jgi:Domain of unknown function (DUF1906)
MFHNKRIGLGAFLLFASLSSAHAVPTCNSHREFPAVDLSQPVTTISMKSGKTGLDGLKAIGVKTIARYYDWVESGTSCKSLFPKESDAIIAAGFSIITIFQHENSDPETFFDKSRGARDAREAIAMAAANGQPAGSAIYFAVDGVDQTVKDSVFEWNVNNGTSVPPARRNRLLTADRSFQKHIKFYERFRQYHRRVFGKHATAVQAGDVLPYVNRYFTDVNRILKADGRYRVGVYGSGLVCKHLTGKKLAEHCWLAMSTGWPMSKEVQASGNWSLVQQQTTFCKGWKFNDREMARFDFNRMKSGDVGQWNKKGRVTPAKVLPSKCRPSW